ncbi:C-type lectin domain family 14 member A [Gasterosteus aculeatus]
METCFNETSSPYQGSAHFLSWREGVWRRNQEKLDIQRQREEKLNVKEINEELDDSEKMESSFCWLPLVIFFRTIWASSPPYTVHSDRVSFHQASELCRPGVLTKLSSQQEVRDVLGFVSGSATPFQEEFNFWVGLKKLKDECVIPTLPLRGFKWTEDGSQEFQVSQWAQEPQDTCTAVRCAVLNGRWDGSNFTSWGLVPVSCKSNYQFICKLRDGGTSAKPAEPEPTELAAPETQNAASPRPPKSVASEPTSPPKPAGLEPTELPKPAASQSTAVLKSAAPEPPTHATPAKSEPRPSTQQPDTSKREPGLPSLGPKPETRPELGSGSCQNPLIPSARSISLDNSSRIQVECWSSDRVELLCSGHPPVWGLLDGSPANFSTVCVPCGSGFRKDESGFCVDVDECAGAACRHSCLNTAGSFRCFCSNQDGERVDEDSPACAEATMAGVLMPVLVATATLALLVLVVAVTVKCCLIRRSKTRAMKKAEKMGMKSDEDSFQRP